MTVTVSVREKIATEMSTLNPKVEAAMVRILADREVEKRSVALVKCWDLLQTAENELKRLRPDHVIFDVTHTKVGEAYSKTQDENRKKIEQRIEKLAKAINKAIDDHDFSDAYNLANSGGKDTPAGGAGGSAEADS